MKPWVKILLALILGVLLGLFAQKEFIFLKQMGGVFISLLRMIVGLLVFSSIVSGICHIKDVKKLGRIGIRTITYYVITTLIAITFGLFFSWILSSKAEVPLVISQETTSSVSYSFSSFLTLLVPDNPIAAFAKGNILQIIIFSIFFSYAIIKTGKMGRRVLNFIESLSEVMFSLAHFIMKLIPYGVFALVASAVGSLGLKVILPLINYLIVNYIACFLQIILIFSGTIRFLAGYRVIPFFKGMKDAIVLAFTTGSSSATLPVSLECAQENLGISKNISGFVLSLGSTMNMNGASIGQSSAAYFIAQLYGIELSWLQIGTIYSICLVTSIGAAGIPGSNIVMLSVILNVLGLPLEGIALIAGVDRIQEMISTATNILGDAAAAVYVAKSEKEIDLDKYLSTSKALENEIK